MLVNLISLNPPIPSSLKNEANECLEGKNLLNLLKSLERSYKSTDRNDSASIEMQVLDILSSMETKFSRKGLLLMNQKRAQQVDNLIHATNSISQSNVGGGKKRKRGGAIGSSGSISSLLNLDNGTSTSEEAYVLSNLCKVLMSPTSEGELNYSTRVIAAAAKVFFVICEYCRNHLSTLTSSIECSMINSIASQFLSGITKTMQKLLLTTSESEDECEHTTDALQNGCLAAATVIMLSNIHLSRSTATIEGLQTTCDEILLYAGKFEENTHLFEAASILNATLPLAGSSSGFTPGQLWSEKLSKTIDNLRSSILYFFPLAKLPKRKKIPSGEDVKGIPSWISHLENTTVSQSNRLNSFIVRIKIYVYTAIHLMKMNGYDISQNLNGVAIPITSILDCCEQLLLFSSIAETKYLSTKSNLRDIVIDGGLLSPNAAVTIANSIKYLGCELFQTTITSLSGNALQYGKQLLRISHTTLHSSSSYVLRRVIDPSSTTDKTSDKKWLHSSLFLRTVAVASFISVLQRLGCSALSTHSDHVTKSLMLVVGNLLEQLRSNSDTVECQDSYWGTTQERIDLICECSDALINFLSIGGGFISMDDRKLVDSMVSTCLSNLKKQTIDMSNIILSSQKIKDSFLRLGIASVSTPWPDGGVSALVEDLRSAALAFRYDSDLTVSSSAYSAFELCSCIMTPRAPPMLIITRTISETEGKMNSRYFLNTETLEESMAAVNEEILKSKLYDQSTEKSKAKNVVDKNAINVQKDAEAIEVLFKKEDIIETTQDDQEKEVDDQECLKDLQSDDANAIEEEEAGSLGMNGDDSNQSEHNAIASTLQFSNEDIDQEDIEVEYTRESILLLQEKKDERQNSDDDNDSFPEIFVDCGPDEEN